MTPAERDEVRRVAQARLKNHAISSEPNSCPCFECDAFRAIATYVPAGVSLVFDVGFLRDLRDGKPAELAAARWTRVAPLIERLQEVDRDASRDRDDVGRAVDALLTAYAAAKEPTP